MPKPDICREEPETCPTCGPKPHEHQTGITGRECAEDYCAGYWKNIAWYEKHKAHESEVPSDA